MEGEEKLYTQKPRRKLLDNGRQIPSANAKYTVVSVLGSGGFGDVYKVKKDEGEECFALKTEDAVNTEKFLMRLKIEAEVLAECARSKSIHFLSLIDRGRTEEFKFIVMPIVWLTLDKVRSDVIKTEQYSKSCATKICIQMFESIKDMHEINYLHRDLKPANFAVGLPESKRNIVYLLDFGICRKYMDNNGNHLPPRSKVAFMGTSRFAPRNAHRLQEQSRRDDLESLCYVMIDIYHNKLIPWRGQRDRLLLIQLKDNFVEKRGSVVISVYEKLPREVERIVKYVAGLCYDETPFYDWILRELGNLIVNCRAPLDWAGLDVDKARLAALKEKEEKEREAMRKEAKTGGSNENKTTTPDNNEKPNDALQVKSVYDALRQATLLKTILGKSKPKAATPLSPSSCKEKSADPPKETGAPKKETSKEKLDSCRAKVKGSKELA